MTGMTDFERDLRAALSEAHAAAAEPTGLADRLVETATSGSSQPRLPDLRRSPRWLPPVLAAAAVLLVAVATGAVVTSTRADRQHPTRPTPTPGLTAPLIAPASLLDVRELGFHVEPGTDIVLTDSWEIDPDRQSTSIKVVGDGYTDVFVAVYYQGRSPDLPSIGPGEALTVNGVAGTYAEKTSVDRDSWEGRITWQYAPNSSAVVSARGAGAPPSDLRDKLLTAAGALRSGGPVMRVPVRFGTVPASLPSPAKAHDVSVSFTDGTWLWWLSVDDVSIWATSRVSGECLGSEGQPQTDEFTFRGFRGCDVAGERIGLHRGNADVFVDYGPHPGLSKEDMKRVLADLTVASDDPTTWFDLKTALGG